MPPERVVNLGREASRGDLGCVCVHVCAMCMCLCMYMCRPEVDAVCLPQCVVALFINGGCLIGLTLFDSARLARSPKDLPVSISPVMRL